MELIFSAIFDEIKTFLCASYLFSGHLNILNNLIALKGLLKTLEAYFIEWTRPVEPPVPLKGLQGSKWSHTKAIL